MLHWSTESNGTRCSALHDLQGVQLLLLHVHIVFNFPSWAELAALLFCGRIGCSSGACIETYNTTLRMILCLKLFHCCIGKAIFLPSWSCFRINVSSFHRQASRYVLYLYNGRYLMYQYIERLYCVSAV